MSETIFPSSFLSRSLRNYSHIDVVVISYYGMPQAMESGLFQEIPNIVTNNFGE